VSASTKESDISVSEIYNNRFINCFTALYVTEFGCGELECVAQRQRPLVHIYTRAIHMDGRRQRAILFTVNQAAISNKHSNQMILHTYSSPLPARATSNDFADQRPDSERIYFRASVESIQAAVLPADLLDGTGASCTLREIGYRLLDVRGSLRRSSACNGTTDYDRPLALLGCGSWKRVRQSLSLYEGEVNTSGNDVFCILSLGGAAWRRVVPEAAAAARKSLVQISYIIGNFLIIYSSSRKLS